MWIVEGYDGHRLDQETVLRGITERDVRRLFAEPGDGPFPVTAKTAHALRRFLPEPLDVGMRRYVVVFVEGGLRDNRYLHWRATHDAVISDDLSRDLLLVTPSRCYGMEYRPCQVMLWDGSVLDRVYVVKARPYLRSWGVAPEDDPGKSSIPIEAVRSLRESPYRLAPHLADKVYRAHESGMGYVVFQVILEDGRVLDCLTGNAVDFLDWPPGVTPAMARDVIPRAGAARTSPDRVRGAPFCWCLYERPASPGSPVELD